MDKKPLIIIITLVLIAAGLSGCTEQTLGDEENNEDGFYTYENAEYGFKIKYPDTWNKEEELLPNTVVTFMLQSGGLGVLSGSLSVTVADIGEMSAEAFKDSHIENISKLYTDINISYESSTTLAGLSAYTLICTYTQGIYTIKQSEIWAIKNSRLYFLTYIVEEEYYTNYVDIIEQMINSFEIL